MQATCFLHRRVTRINDIRLMLSASWRARNLEWETLYGYQIWFPNQRTLGCPYIFRTRGTGTPAFLFVIWNGTQKRRGQDMTEGYDWDNPSGDRPFNICPRGGDYGPQIAKSIIISTLFGAERIERTGRATNVFVKCRATTLLLPTPGLCKVSRGVPFSPPHYPACTTTPPLAPTPHLRVRKLLLPV